MLQSDNFPYHLRTFIPSPNSCINPPHLFKFLTTRMLDNTTMAAHRRSGLVALKHLIKKLQIHLQLRKVNVLIGFVCEEEDAAPERVPDDVKEGHFAVLAKKDEEEKPMRFVVELSVLKHPPFLRLLELAEDKFGFQQNGTLELPCQPEELRRILQDRNRY